MNIKDGFGQLNVGHPCLENKDNADDGHKQASDLSVFRGGGISLVDFKRITMAGKFHEKHLATCPVLPRFHATFGEPSEP